MQKHIAIEVKNLYVDFDSVTSIAQANFEVLQGEIFALIGPNGSGKTTLLRVLATLQEPNDWKSKNCWI